MIFAAGFGTRMRSLTKEQPKPLIKVAGRSLIDRSLDLADDANIPLKVVNTHYLGHLLSEHLSHRDDVVISHEEGYARETGGGLKYALPLLGSEPVFTMNPDAIWTGPNPLTTLGDAWKPEHMQGLLLLVPVSRAMGYEKTGDFTLDATGRVSRYTGSGQPFVYSSVQILCTGGLSHFDDDLFSLNLLWNRMIEDGSLFGVVHPGGWVDVGSPEGIILAEDLLAGGADV